MARVESEVGNGDVGEGSEGDGGEAARGNDVVAMATGRLHSAADHTPDCTTTVIYIHNHVNIISIYTSTAMVSCSYTNV